MTLEIPKRGRGRPKKVRPSADEEIMRAMREYNAQFPDIPEPEPVDALADIRSASEIGLITVLTILGLVAAIYLMTRIA